MNLKEWAVTQGVSCSTVLRWHKDGVLPVPTCQVGRLVVIGDGAVSRTSGTTVVYARVSSADQRPDLDRQVSRVTTWATGQHLPVDRVVTEVGSALNGKRRKFLALLKDLYGRRAAANLAARMVECATVAGCPDGAL